MSAMRLDILLASRFSLSRRKAREYIESGRVDVAGKTCREPGREVNDHTPVVFDINRPPAGRVQSKLVVLHEDADLIVVEKPAGLLTLPTDERERDTLLARVNAYLLVRYRKRPYVGVVHRLDKETSGTLVFARSREILRALQELFRRHDIGREYLAIVEGRVPKESGTISADLVADRGDRRRGTARPGETGRRAVTHYRIEERFASATLLAVRLETGRTHQIRVHLAKLGHPVVGDRVYRPRHFTTIPIAAPRQMLHARLLEFRHPRSGEIVRTQAPPPADFLGVLRALRARRATGRRPS